jgi:hypothetical protein
MYFDGLDEGAKITCGNWASFYSLIEPELDPLLEAIADTSEYLSCFHMIFEGETLFNGDAKLLDSFPNYWESGWNVNKRNGGMRVPFVNYCPDKAKFPAGSSLFIGTGCRSRDSPNRCGRVDPDDIPGAVPSPDFCFTLRTGTFTFNWDLVITAPSEGSSVNIIDNEITVDYYVGETIKDKLTPEQLSQGQIVLREEDEDGDVVATVRLQKAEEVETYFVFGSGRVATRVRLPASLPTPAKYHLTLTLDEGNAVPATSTVELWRLPYKGDHCNLPALAMSRTMESYGSDTRTASNIDPVTVTPLPGCVVRETGEPLEMTGIIVYSSAQFHVSVYATNWLAQTYGEIQKTGDMLSRPLSGEDYDVDPSLKYLKPPGREMVTIAFRGSTNVADWASTNADVRFFDCDDGNLGCTDNEDDDDGSGQLHRGIALEYLAVRQKLAYLYYIMYGVNGQGGTIDLLFTGHSQGGAIAQLAAQDFKHFHKVDLGLDKVFRQKWFENPFILDVASSAATFTVNVVTFGSPRVGFSSFRTTFDRMIGDEHYARFEGNGDIIPETPTGLGYTSAGTQITLPCGYLNTRTCHTLHSYAKLLFENEWVDDDDAAALQLDDLLAYSPTLAASQRLTSSDEEGAALSPVVIAVIVSSASLLCCCALAAVGATIVVSARRRRKHVTAATVVGGPVSSSSAAAPRRSRSASRTSNTHRHSVKLRQ